MKYLQRKVCVLSFVLCALISLFPLFLYPLNVSAEYEITDDFSVAFPKNQKLFHADGGSVLLSTDGEKYTKAALLTDSNNSESALWVLQFSYVYTDALSDGGFLYLLEKPGPSGTKIGRLDIGTQAFHTYTAAVRPSSPLQWEILADKSLSLRAVQLTDSRPGTFRIQMERKPYEASFTADAASAESTPSSSGKPSEKPEEDAPVKSIVHTFPEGATVSSLEKEYGGSAHIVVSDAAGNPQTSGRIHTGWTIRLYEGTRLTSIVTVRIPGDIGGQTDAANRDLYFRYLAGELHLSEPYRTAADLNQDGSITVADLVLFRKSHG